MAIVYLIVIGLVVGALAKFLMPGPDPGGIIVTILLGIAGAMVGGWLGHVLGIYEPDRPAGLIMSVVGAMVLLGIYRVVRGRPT
jgi:uncharacterized membrane protein YeaQ/YmgE (transglycosylase-associated protein family)